MDLSRDKRSDKNSLRNVLLLTDKELDYLLADVSQVSLEYYVSKEYQEFSDKFKELCKRIEL